MFISKRIYIKKENKYASVYVNYNAPNLRDVSFYDNNRIELKFANEGIENAVIPVPVGILTDSTAGKFVCKYKERKKYFLNNFIFSSSLYNENHSNALNGNSDQNHDSGHFFTKFDYSYTAKEWIDGEGINSDNILSMVKFGLGFVPNLGMILKAYSALEIISNIENSYKGEFKSISNKATSDPNYTTKADQLR